MRLITIFENDQALAGACFVGQVSDVPQFTLSRRRILDLAEKNPAYALSQGFGPVGAHGLRVQIVTLDNGK